MNIKRLFIRSLLAGSCFFFSFDLVAQSLGSKDAELVVSRGTTIHVLTEKGATVTNRTNLRGKPLAWLPIGTRVARFPSTEVRIRGRNRVKAITEDGIWGYVVVGEQNFFDETAVVGFARDRTIVFIEQNTNGDVLDVQDCKIMLKRGNHYKFIEYKFNANGDEMAVIVLGSRHGSEKCGDSVLGENSKIVIPTRQVQVIDFDRNLTKLDIAGPTADFFRGKILRKTLQQFENNSYVWSRPLIKRCETIINITSRSLFEWEASFSARLGVGKLIDIGAALATTVRERRDTVAQTKYENGVEVRQYIAVNKARGRVHGQELFVTHTCPVPSNAYATYFAIYRGHDGTSIPLRKNEIGALELHQNTLRIRAKCLEQYRSIQRMIKDWIGQANEDAISTIVARMVRIDFRSAGAECPHRTS